jgi:hypothetical protein
MKGLERNGPKVKWSSKFLIYSTLVLFSHGLLGQQLEGSIEVTPDSLSIKVGQMVMIGLGEFQLPEEADAILPEIKAGKVGGVVIYDTLFITSSHYAKGTISFSNSSIYIYR